jgi:hypothetical protein
MPQPRVFPFRRVSVDHMVRGATRVWWQLEPLFREPGPYVFQLQLGKTGLRDALDWVNVGAPVTNAFMAWDPEWRETGYELLSHYRVTLTTPTNIYVSQAASCFGELPERDWLIGREIIRKEKLRHRYVSTPGYLIKPMRYGEPCPRCRDQLTQEVTDSDCPVCNGTGFKIGYHPPLDMQCWDLSPQTIAEDVDAQLKGATRTDPYVTARVIGFPALNKYDIWANAASDERWLVDTIQIVAAIRNVPLVYSVRMGLLPFNNTAYAVEVGGEASDRDPIRPPFEGCGNIVVDHNYGGADVLAYRDATNYSVEGAEVYVFRKDVFDAAYPALPDRVLAAGHTRTISNGRWAQSLLLFAGDYVVLYEKLGEYGPDTQVITVAAGGDPGYVWVANAALGEEDDDPATPVVNEEEIIATEEDTPEDVVTDDPQRVPNPNPPPPPSNDDFWNV